ncbi:ROK family transcriptional regulator [Streptomyces boluensis]|uniref:ROK family protein n=1 Tax=Streptomyces boluensis TaxID=1775135 RepID=A0A964UX23_9ACTN|nr:ROK family transcriptional regulator [Streptomyces boluensis]NBE55873.1 ROK family protein [Streptomyces boluensis]
MTRRPAHGDLIRTEILALLGSAGPLGRAEIAARLGVGAATVTEHTRRLIGEGFLRELTPRASGTGRPRVPLELVSDAAHVLGIRVAVDHLVGTVVRLDGQIVDEFRLAERVAAAPVRLLTEVVRHEIDARRDTTPIRGVGFAVPGMADPEAGVVRLSGIMNWHGLPLGAELSRELPVPVLVDNDLRASTTAELLFGMGREHDDFLVLGIGDGLGMGVVLERRVQRGADGSSGEFGHLPVDPEGPDCTCGNRGCLQALVGQAALLDRARRAGVRIAPEDGLPGLVAAAERGEREVLRLLSDAGALLGRCVAGVVNVLAVKAVKVIGESHVLWPYLGPSFTASAGAGVIEPLKDLSVTVSPWRDTEHARGAACLLLARSGALTRTLPH